MIIEVIEQIIALLLVLFGSLFFINGFAEHNWLGGFKHRSSK